MDLDHAAVFFPLALGIAAALVTVYPSQGRARHLWAGGFLLISVIAAIVTWKAVDSSQSFQQQVITNITGGDNYGYLLPENTRESGEKAFQLTFIKNSSSPIFNVYGNIMRSEQGGELKPVFQIDLPVIEGQKLYFDAVVTEGRYFAVIQSRNYRIEEFIKITRNEDGNLKTLTLVWGV